MNLLVWIVLGALAGWIASVIMKRGEKGLLTDVVLGVLGGVAGGVVMNFFGQPGVTGLNIYSLVVAIAGAVLLIWIGRLMYR